MKRTLSCITALLFIAGCFYCFKITGFAESSDKLLSKPIAAPIIDIETVLNNKVTEQIVEERYEMFPGDKPKNYTFDTSVYLLEYDVSTNYWDSVTSLDYKGLTEKIDYKYPTIYIPLFGDIEDSKGNISNRTIGYIKLSYDLIKKDYRFNMVLYNLGSDNYKNRRTVGFYETITDYLSQSKTATQQVFLIRYPSSLTDEHEMVAVIQSKTDVIILDITNSCQVQTEKTSGQPTVYSVSEYRTLRMEAEKTVYQTAKEWETNPAGGVANTEQNDKTVWIYFSLCIISATIILIGTLYFVFRKRRKTHSA